MDTQESKHKSRQQDLVEEDKHGKEDISNDQHNMKDMEEEGRLDLVKVVYVYLA
jgi:hypothetical protein